ncbi:unnamed protein product [Blepharisma stoltei]|uniref:LITAF domain-containing protein n=1 Tax=Blepharisma stoltei TaxID=1481888 RepID=A0AAU9IM33_9CILI|nr:unnamed protein product [Blepharisma stoltei]
MEPDCTTPLQIESNSIISSEPSPRGTPMVSDQPNPIFSDQRYASSDSFETPERQGTEFSSSAIFGFSRNSTEKIHPHSKLLRITQMRPGDRRPREILLPIFYHQRHTPKYREHANLSMQTEPKSLSQILEGLRENPRSKFGSRSRVHRSNRKRVSFGSDLGDPIEIEGFSSIGRSSGQSFFDSILSIPKDKDKFSNSSLDSLEIEEIIPTKAKESMATIPTATNSVAEPKSSAIYPLSKNQAMQLVEEEKIITTQAGTVSTQGNVDNEEVPDLFYEREVFEYEQEAKASSVFQQVSEFNEYPAVIYCENCKKEIITTVKPEIKQEKGFFKKLDSFLCCCSNLWMKSHVLVHSCPICNQEIAKVSA